MLKNLPKPDLQDQNQYLLTTGTKCVTFRLICSFKICKCSFILTEDVQSYHETNKRTGD
jgi:hypothetical protein